MRRLGPGNATCAGRGAASAAGADAVATYVFDEVDAGICGAAAEVVGRQIRSVAAERQVLCVTHLPQIAALADAHLHVERTERDGRTETLVECLSPEARREEMARMLRGLRVPESARAHADELIQRRGRPRKARRRDLSPRALRAARRAAGPLRGPSSPLPGRCVARGCGHHRLVPFSCKGRHARPAMPGG